ncbi:MAG: hypothetical protein JRH20_15270 [Deltaproteobacteria bacterium]|nr:hypothetical protein [Deltaproteobacteria bacterium]
MCYLRSLSFIISFLAIFGAEAAAQWRACQSQLKISTEPASQVVVAGQPMELIAREGCRGEKEPAVRWEMCIAPSKVFTRMQPISLGSGRWQWMTPVAGEYRIRATEVTRGDFVEMVVFVAGQGLAAAEVRFMPQVKRKQPLDQSKPLRVVWVGSAPGPRFTIPWSTGKGKRKGSEALSLPLGRYDLYATRVGGGEARARVHIQRKGVLKPRLSGAELSVDFGWAPKGMRIRAELHEADGRIERRDVAADGRLWFSSVVAGRAELTLKVGGREKKLKITIPSAGRVERVLSAARLLAGERHLEPGSWRTLPGASQTETATGPAPTTAGGIMQLERGRLVMVGAKESWWLQGKKWLHQPLGGLLWRTPPVAVAIAGESWAWVGGELGFRTPVTYRNPNGLSQELLRFGDPCQATGIAAIGKAGLVVVGLCRDRPGAPVRGFIAERTTRGWSFSRAPRALRGVAALGGRVQAWGAGGLVMERSKKGWRPVALKTSNGAPEASNLKAGLVVFDGLWLSDGHRVGFRSKSKGLQWFDLKKKGRPTQVMQLATAAEGEVFVLLNRASRGKRCELQRHSVVLRLGRGGKSVAVDERRAIFCTCDRLRSPCRSKGRKPVSSIAGDGDALWGFTDRPSVL